MSYKEHALRELKLVGYDLEDTEEGPNKWMVENILELLEVFSKQGHSGSSAPYAIKIFEKLASFEPLTPLTGADDEWNKIDEGCWQNKRLSRVFKGADGRAYDISGKVFRRPGGCYQCRDSRVYITFPYTQKTEIVEVSEETPV